MIRYPCPLPTCQWFYRHAATPATADVPTDILSWTPANWASMAERTGPDLAAAHVIDAHLVTHSPVQWMTELGRERRRADDAEAERDRLHGTAAKLAEFTIAVDTVTRMPTRGEVEATRELLMYAVNGGGNDDEA